jgi:putative endonuclease
MENPEGTRLCLRAEWVMHQAYILESGLDGTFYKGSCADLEKRLADHNAGRVRSTKHRRPWSVRYSESFANRSEALKREHFFKSRSGYRWLKDKGVL